MILLFGANSSGVTLHPTMEYLFSLAIGAPAHLFTLYMIPLFQPDEKKRLIDLATVTMTVVNVCLNILFVIGNMGIKGIGYSTSISYYVALIILSTHFFEKKQGILLRGKFSIDLRCLIEAVKEGTPSAFKNISSIIYNTFVNNLIARVATTDAMAAFSVFKMTKFIFLSVSEAIISPVRMIQSMLIEEKDRKMLRAIFRYSILKGMILSVILSGPLLQSLMHIRNTVILSHGIFGSLQLFRNMLNLLALSVPDERDSTNVLFHLYKFSVNLKHICLVLT